MRRRCLRSRASSIIRRNSCEERSARSRKWRMPFVLIRRLRDELARATPQCAAHAASSRCMASLTSASRDDQRRQQAHDIFAGSDREQSLGAACIHDVAVRDDGAKTEQQSLAAHFRDHGRVAVLHLGEPLLEQEAGLFHRVEKARREHDIQHRIADTAVASGLPPKVEPCVPAVMPLAASAVARHAPIGNPPPRPFGDRHDVRRRRPAHS